MISVDISSMSRVWYGAIVKELALSTRQADVIVDFYYYPRRVLRAVTDEAPAEFTGPVVGFSSVSTPNRPIALMLGIGQDAQRELGLQELVEPSKTIAFYPDRAFGYTLDEGRRLFPNASSKPRPYERVQYRLEDPGFVFSVLESIAHGLAEDWRVLFISVGPKLFSLLGFLLHVRRPSVSVWRISAGTRRVPVDVAAATPRLSVLRTYWGAGVAMA
ncbi:MAG TPA: hypothetical protein VNJ70_05350 [Thermoanaerobaculia bacterium]|nr:hypothetical protein [Thermoanaerobaculia bacterium]